MKKALSLILAASLVVVGVPGSAAVFGPDTVWGNVPAGAAAASNAVLLDAAGKARAMVPIVDGKFAFRGIGPGHYTVALQTIEANVLARSLPVDLAAGGEVEAIFGRDTPPAAALPPSATPPPVITGGGPGTTGWILIGAAAVGITALIIATNDDEGVASPSR